MFVNALNYQSQSLATNKFNKKNPNKEINFTAKALGDVKIKALVGDTYVPVDARFYEFSKYDVSDIEAMDEIIAKWEDATYIRSIVKYFQKGSSNTLGLALKANEKPMSERLLSLSDLSFDYTSNGLEIDFIESNPKNRVDPRPFKGPGEVLIAAIARFAQKEGSSQVIIDSNNDFYDHIGISYKPDWGGASYRGLEDEEINEFIARVESKYGYQYEACQT